MTLPEQIAVVLVEPQSPGNLGMVSRAMKNMGLKDLRIVKGCRIDHPEAFKFAVSARDVLLGATRYDSLEQALADTVISIATTRRLGKYRQETMEPRQAALMVREKIGAGRAALVFGREDNGLTTDELALCRWQATIPAADDYGSLNMAQAVLIFCYELSREFGKEFKTADREMADSGEMEALFAQMEKTLLRIGFLDEANPDHLMRTLRRIFFRAELDLREVAVLRGMMSQMDWAADISKTREVP